MSIKNKLLEEFSDEIGGLAKIELGSEQYKTTVDGVTKLADRIIEIDKIETENNLKIETQNTENELKLQQMDDDKRDRVIRNVIEGTKIVGGLGLACWAFVASMNFEKEGTLTTQGGRKALDQLLKFTRF